MIIYWFIFFYFTSVQFSFLLLFQFCLNIFKRNRLPPKKLYKFIISIIVEVINLYLLKKIFSFNAIASLVYSTLILIISFIIHDYLTLIGVTGQISSGKTTFINYIHERYKYPVISFDELNRQVLENPSVLNDINKKFGEDVFYYDFKTNMKKLNKQKLKEIIFKDKNKRKALENITHLKIFLLFFQIYIKEKLIKLNKFVFVENALLIRFWILRALCNNIISIVVNNPDTLFQRVIKRDNISNETSRNIIQNQSTVSQFKDYSNYIIFNDKDIFSFEIKIREVINKIIN